MHILEAAALLQLRRPRVRRTERVLARCVTVEDLRTEARRRWPRGVLGYVEGGADGEVTLRRNRAAYEAVELVPSVLRDVSSVDLATDLLGCASALPFALGPTGFTRMMHPDGELASARAARRTGIAYTLSTMATVALEDVAREGGQLWFQLYIWRDRELTKDLLRRAQAAGYGVLVVTVDTPVTGLRARDHHNGFTLPPRLTPSALADMAMHPAWCLGLLRGAPITFANFAAEVSATSENVMEFAARQFDPSVTWDDIAEIRAMWDGPMLLKGMFGPDDARRAQDSGMDGIALSNHGGRQLDQTVPPIRALEVIREAVGEQMPILVDSGIRHGADIAIALAAGATGALIGRPYLYGLGAAGQAGCEAAIGMLADELRRAMRLLGVRTTAELRQRGPELLRVAPTR
jgi:L-lactate dehydrogenase (cytochrome)